VSTIKMDDTYAAALRSALVERVQTRARVTSRHRRRRIIASAIVGLGIVGGGVAAAAEYVTAPGGDDAQPLATAVTGEHTGPAVVDLGAAPAGADHIELQLTCLTAGTFTFADGATLTCSSTDAATGLGTGTYRLPLRPGQHTTAIETSSKARWRLSVTYSSVRTTAWGVNESGQTYGVANAKGTPDLVSVVASNGKLGYIDSRELEGPTPTSPSQALAWQNGPQEDVQLLVYESDGKTVIGHFPVRRPALAPSR
jgi:hypothetical protein